MEGFVELANRRLGRYAVRTDAGDYTLFETADGVALEVDELVWGDFCAIPGDVYRTERHGTVAVTALCCHAAHGDAWRWVHERQVQAGGG